MANYDTTDGGYGNRTSYTDGGYGNRTSYTDGGYGKTGVRIAGSNITSLQLRELVRGRALNLLKRVGYDVVTRMIVDNAGDGNPA